jgi:LmbE family N-acetylglucosaminyl deacetylase
MKFSAATLVFTGALGILVGTLISDRGPRVAFANPAPTPEPQAINPQPAPPDGKLRIIVFGAHPDDAEYRGAGVAIKWARAGHHVKLVSATNGDIGHWESAGGPLAKRRLEEVRAVAKAMGVTNEVLDNHDGELMPTLENRRTFARLIREWNADIVMSNRPNDYHPDHRYTSILMQDSAYMVGVPFFTQIPPLRRNPVFFYTSDRFMKPNPFTADVAVGIDEVIEPMLDALLLMKSQIHEGGADGHPGIYPADNPSGRQKRDTDVRTNLARRYEQQANQYREALIKFYGPEKGKAIKYAQAFELCEYGRRPNQEEMKTLFPF